MPDDEAILGDAAYLLDLGPDDRESLRQAAAEGAQRWWVRRMLQAALERRSW